MLRAAVKKIIDTQPLTIGRKTALYSLAADLGKADMWSNDKLYRVRYELNALLYANRKHQTIIGTVLYAIKKITVSENTSYRDGHEVSDHAFCSALRRLGYDLNRFKDMAKKEALNAGLKPVIYGTNIVTFLPRPK